MKQSRVYHSAIIGVTSLVIGSATFTNKVYAEENTADNSSSTSEEESSDSSNAAKVNKVVVEQNTQNSDQTADSASAEKDDTDTSTHKDTLWEPAPPLARAQDTNFSNDGNVSSDGVVRPHAQSVSKKQNKKAKKSKTQTKATKSYATSNNSTKNYFVKAQTSTQIGSATISQTNNVKTAKQTAAIVTNQTLNGKILPQTGVSDQPELALAGAISVSLSMVGLAGIKQRKNQA